MSDHCKSCGVSWEDHVGMQGMCESNAMLRKRLVIALNALNQIKHPLFIGKLGKKNIDQDDQLVATIALEEIEKIKDE